MTPPSTVRQPSTPPTRPAKTPKTTDTAVDARGPTKVAQDRVEEALDRVAQDGRTDMTAAATLTPWHRRLSTKVYAGRVEVRATDVREPFVEADAALLVIRWAALLSPRTPVVELTLDDAAVDLDADASAPPQTTKADAVSAVLAWFVLRLLALLLSDARIVLRRCRVTRKEYVATVERATVDVSLAPPRVANTTPREAIATALRAAAAGTAGTRGSVAFVAEGVDAKGRTGNQVLAADRLCGRGCVAIAGATALDASVEADGASIRGRAPQAFRARATATLRDGTCERADGALTVATAAEDALSVALTIDGDRRSVRVVVSQPLDETLPRAWVEYFSQGESQALDVDLEMRARARLGLANDDGSVVAVVVEAGGRLSTKNQTTTASASLEVEVDDDTVLRLEDARIDASPALTAFRAATCVVRCTPARARTLQNLLPVSTSSKGKRRLEIGRVEATLFDGADVSDRRAFCVHLNVDGLAALAEHEKVAARCAGLEVFSRGPRATRETPAFKAFVEGGGDALVARFSPGKLELALAGVEAEVDEAAVADARGCLAAFSLGSASTGGAVALTATRVACTYRVAGGAVAFEGDHLRWTPTTAALAALRLRAGPYEADLIEAANVALVMNDAYRVTCDDVDVAYQGAAWGVVLEAWGEALPASTSTSEAVVFSLHAQRATVGAPASRTGLRHARLSAASVACTVDGLGRWAVDAQRPRLETAESSTVRQLADLGSELTCRVAWASDDGLIVTARVPAVRATSSLTHYDHALIRAVVWRTLGGGDEAATSTPLRSLAITVHAGTADLRLEDAGRVASTGVRLEIIRAHGASTKFTVACAAATVYDPSKKAIASPESAGRGDALEFSVGAGDADLGGVRASLTSLITRRTSVVWRSQAWWAFRDFFKYDHARDARDGPTDGLPPLQEDQRPWAFRLALEQGCVALPPARKLKTPLELRGDMVRYDYDSREASHRGEWTAKDIDAACGALKLENVARASVHLSPDGARRHVSVEGASAITAPGEAAFAAGVADVVGCVSRALGYDDDVLDEAPSDLLLLETRVESLTARAGAVGVALTSLAYGRRRASTAAPWLAAVRAAALEVTTASENARGILGRLSLNAAPRGVAGALEKGFRADAQEDGAWVLDVPTVSVLKPEPVAALAAAVATHAPPGGAGSLRLALGALRVQASSTTVLTVGACRATRAADSASANIRDAALTVDDRHVAACAALTLSSFRGRVAVAGDALCRVDAARVPEVQAALAHLAALAPGSGSSSEPLTLAIGDLEVTHGAWIMGGSLTAAYANDAVEAHVQATQATNGSISLSAPSAIDAKLVRGGAGWELQAEATPVELTAGAAISCSSVVLRSDDRGTAILGRAVTASTASFTATLATDNGNPARPTALLAWASADGWDALLIADVPVQADALDEWLRTLPRATIALDVNGRRVDVRAPRVSLAAGVVTVADAAISAGATSFTTTIQVEATDPPRVSLHAPLAYELTPLQAGAAAAVASSIAAGAGPGACRAASGLEDGAFPALDDVLALYAALHTQEAEAIVKRAPRVRTFAGARLGLVLVRKDHGIEVEEVGGAEAKVLGVRKGDILVEIAGDAVSPTETVNDVAQRISVAERPLALTLLAPIVREVTPVTPPAIKLALTGGVRLVLTRSDARPLLRVALDAIDVSAQKVDVQGLRIDGFRSASWEPLLEPCGATLVLAADGAAVTFLEDGNDVALRVNVSASLLASAREACAPLRTDGASSSRKLALSSPSSAVSFLEGNSDEPQGEAFVVSVDGLFATYEASEVTGTKLRLAATSLQVDAHGGAAFPVVLRPTPKRDEEKSHAPFIALSLDGNADDIGGALHITRSLDLNVDEATVVRALALMNSLKVKASAPSSKRRVGRVSASRLKARLSVRWNSTGETLAPELAACLPAMDTSSTLRKLLDVFAAVERSRVALPSFEIEGSRDRAALMATAAQHYKKAFSKNALEIAGSLRAFGNPLGLARGLQRGLEDAVREPIQGLLNARDAEEPLEAFAVGFERGARSLAKHAVGGTAGSLAQITGNISRAASHLALDDVYLAAQRAKDDARRDEGEAAREEDIAAVDGLASGFDSFVGGIVDGVTTLVQLPVRGAEKSGVSGAAVGAAKGALGMVVKPVVGVADAATDVLRGIRDTTDDAEEDSEDRRVLDLLVDSAALQRRPARALYGQERVLRTYSYDDAKAAAWLLQACYELLGDVPPGADAFLQRVPLGDGAELVVAEGAVAVVHATGVEFVAPAALILGCTREEPGAAVVLIAAAAPTSGSVAEPPRRHVVPFASETHGDALADAVGDILARRAAAAVPTARW